MCGKREKGKGKREKGKGKREKGKGSLCNPRAKYSKIIPAYLIGCDIKYKLIES